MKTLTFLKKFVSGETHITIVDIGDGIRYDGYLDELPVHLIRNTYVLEVAPSAYWNDLIITVQEA